MPSHTKFGRIPSCRLHKARNQAVVMIGGRDVYPGLYGAQISRDTYDRVVSEWLASGRVLRQQRSG